MTTPPTPRRASGRRNTTSTPPRAALFVAEALFADKSVKRKIPKDVEDAANSGQPAPQREKSKAKRQSLDLGKPLGPFDNNSVRARVRKWQAQGGGVIEQRDPVVYPPETTPPVSEVDTDLEKGSDGQPFKFEGPMKTRTRKDAKLKAKESERAKDELVTESQDSKSSSPKKRVVSDSNWRKRQSNGGDGCSGMGQRKYGPASPSTQYDDDKEDCISRDNSSHRQRRRRKEANTTQDIDDGIRVRPILEMPIDENSGSHSFGDGEKVAEPVTKRVESDGIRVFSTPLRQHENHLSDKSKPKSKDDPGTPSSRRKRKSSPIPRTPSTKRTTSDGSQHNASKQWSPTSAAALNAMKSSGSTSRNRKPSRSHEKNQDHSRKFSPRGLSKVNILKEVYDEGKKIFAKPQEPPPLHRSGQRIEAWLNETSDPFLDDPPASIIDFEISKSSQNQVFESEIQTLSNTYTANEMLEESFGASNDQIYVEKPSDGSARQAEDQENLGDEVALAKAEMRSVRSRSNSHVEKTEPTPANTPPSLRRTGAKRGTPPRSNRRSAHVKGDALVGLSEEQDNLSDLNQQAPIFFEKRPFPRTGAHPLSTILSVETNSVVEPQDPIPEPRFHEPTAIPGESQIPTHQTSLKRRLTTHADLISVLSLPAGGNQSIRSARSIRTNRSKLSKATISDLMKELASDEAKYIRELRTLVDGVIPVLLTCVLSKTDSTVAAGLFSRSVSGSEDSVITKPIVDMGIALERLKSLHKRIPLHDPERLLTWANGAQKVYSDYLKAWRLGFQDVIVNLAPSTDSQKSPSDDHSVYNGLPQNSEGDITNGDGERVDVAFLLKRPLVRLKYLAKTFKGINFLKPSFTADNMAAKYEDLVAEARTRSNEERARLEDEAAANIDPSKTRDLRSLAPLPGVTIDSSRRVRARDCFNLEMQHSSGQRLDCRVELFLRDNASGSGAGGDVLICEIDPTGRWLLFPPTNLEQLSARNGDKKGEIVIMLRGSNADGLEWQELLTMTTDDEEAGFEWVQMIGLTPIPPTIERSQSFVKRQGHSQSALVPLKGSKSRTPSPTQIDVPFGESIPQSTEPYQSPLFPEPLSPKHKSTTTARTPNQDLTSQVRDDRSLQNNTKLEPYQDLNDAMLKAGDSPAPKLRRQRARKYSRAAEGSSSPSKPLRVSTAVDHDTFSSRESSPGQDDSLSRESRSQSNQNSLKSQQRPGAVPLSPRLGESVEANQQKLGELGVKDVTSDPRLSPATPLLRDRMSSAPSLELPTIPKVRKEGQMDKSPDQATLKSSQPTSPKSAPARHGKRDSRSPETGKTVGPDATSRHSPNPIDSSRPPPPPAHGRNPKETAASKDAKQLALSPTTTLPPRPSKHRRSSSPLKHEYEPSTASDSEVSHGSSVEEDDDSISDATTDEELEDGDAPTPLLPVGALQKIHKTSPPGSLYSLPNRTLGPSQSASQAPFRTVPQQPQKASRTIASIFSWSEKGVWESLHPEDCSIMVTPGLIEAFKMSADHSRPFSVLANEVDSYSNLAVQPLVGLELTPLVPLRRGTALDISIRSPPTPRSMIKSGSNIMFRSRNAEECEVLYSLINQARINNPTYIALQNARAHTETLNRLERQTSARHSRSRWGWGSRSSYRATSSGRGPGSTAMSDSSVGTLASAFSALRQFGNSGSSGSRLFNISKSTVSSRAGGIGIGGSGSNSLYSSSSGSSTPMPPLPDGLKPASPGIGLSNAKIRLYHRETANRWRDMGSARLTITVPTPSAMIDSNVAPAVSAPVGAGEGEAQKRVLVIGKSKGECLLDVCLGESCFERIARTGIALSIWEEVFGPNGEAGQIPKEGGVGSGRRGVYMIQMKSEAETAYTFSLVGKMRY